MSRAIPTIGTTVSENSWYRLNTGSAGSWASAVVLGKTSLVNDEMWIRYLDIYEDGAPVYYEFMIQDLWLPYNPSAQEEIFFLERLLD